MEVGIVIGECTSVRNFIKITPFMKISELRTKLYELVDYQIDSLCEHGLDSLKKEEEDSL